MASASLLSLIKARRSIRKLKEKPVPLRLVLEALDAATWAPSAHNAQPWRFIVITDAAVKRGLATAMAEVWKKDLLRDGVPKAEAEKLVAESIERFARAPVLVLACMTMEGMHTYPDERRQRAEYLMAVQSVAASIQNFLLAVSALGLGGCWYCAPLFCQEAVRRVLGIPPDVEPQALLAVGFPDERPTPPPRKPLEEVVYLERWGQRVGGDAGER